MTTAFVTAPGRRITAEIKLKLNKFQQETSLAELGRMRVTVPGRGAALVWTDYRLTFYFSIGHVSELTIQLVEFTPGRGQLNFVTSFAFCENC